MRILFVVFWKINFNLPNAGWVVAGLAPNGLAVVPEPNILVVGCVAPKIDVVAGDVEVTVPNGLAVVAAGVPNIFVVGAVLVPNANGCVAVVVAAKNHRLNKIYWPIKRVIRTEWTRGCCTTITENTRRCWCNWCSRKCC